MRLIPSCLCCAHFQLDCAGKEQLQAHLFNVAAAVPKSFEFKVDEISCDEGNGNVGVQWHVESNGKPLPFTRGCSMYRVNKQGLITKGFDVPEPTLKSGSVSLFILQIASKLISEPIRVLALLSWAFYCWFLFLSDVAPGVNALQLDPGTWKEVKDLSLNFWLVLPITAPDAAPIVHPVLEGVFNLLLAYAALFIGFIVDGRSSYGNKNSMGPYLIGMQFLTNALYLPYLVTREPESEKRPATYNSPLTVFERIGESKVTPIVLAVIAAVSITWGCVGRQEFGDLNERLASFQSLLMSDRLTFSFVVDLAYFAVFQGWLIDDDARRRNFDNSAEKTFAKAFPFIGLVYYLLRRPNLPNPKN